ncbi:MAG: hypothetical protein ACFFFT_03330 [Candidatus Thorarchaeota archaeon]
MNLEKDYEDLYQHWLKEFQQVELTRLDQKLFDKYNTLLNSLNNHQEYETNSIKFELFGTYKKNINYLSEDLLKMRELKIINSALVLKEINLDNVIEAEKLLYQNLIGSIKGYKKVKAISTFSGGEELKIKEQIKFKDELEPEVDQSEVSIEESIISEIANEQKVEQVEFTLLRFLKKTPPLVGIDLINYGPFEEEDIAYIPSQNANILVLEKFAEKVEIPP